jgi:transposase
LGCNRHYYLGRADTGRAPGLPTRFFAAPAAAGAATATTKRAGSSRPPHAVIVVDHFHLVRLANQTVTKARQQVTRQVLGRRGTSKDPAWANRRSLLRARERLSDQAYSRMWEQILAQEPTGELLATWIAREELRFLLALARTHAPRSELSNRLAAFYDGCARANVPEVTALAKTIDAWWTQILAFLDTGITSAATETNNRLVKDAARIAYGFRNLDNQRRRVRLHLPTQNDQQSDARVTSTPKFEEPLCVELCSAADSSD